MKGAQYNDMSTVLLRLTEVWMFYRLGLRSADIKEDPHNAAEL